MPSTNSTTSNVFAGRRLAAAGDWSVDEQRYLYEKTRQLKEAWTQKGDISPFRVTDPSIAVYLMFLEPSTRTRESFRSAACFHDVTLNIFDAATSSFTKKESIVDTIKMLVAYNHQCIFIMRTKMEGVCLALEEKLVPYAKRMGRQKPIFLNAGDGRHEHPTQEFLDEFTFMEQKQWDDSELHVALIGDLLHGRTVHSKGKMVLINNTMQLQLK